MFHFLLRQVSPPPSLGPPMHASVQQIQQVGTLLVKHLLKEDLEAVSDSLIGTVYSFMLKSYYHLYGQN